MSDKTKKAAVVLEPDLVVRFKDQYLEYMEQAIHDPRIIDLSSDSQEQMQLAHAMVLGRFTRKVEREMDMPVMLVREKSLPFQFKNKT